MTKATPQSIFTARQRMAAADMERLEIKLETMQNLRPEYHDDLAKMITGLCRIQKRLDQLGKGAENAS